MVFETRCRGGGLIEVEIGSVVGFGEAGFAIALHPLGTKALVLDDWALDYGAGTAHKPKAHAEEIGILSHLFKLW